MHNVEIFLNQIQCQVLQKSWEIEKTERLAKLKKTQQENLRFKENESKSKFKFGLILIISILAILFILFWETIIAFAIIFGIVTFLPFSIWLLFSKHETLFDRVYDYLK